MSVPASQDALARLIEELEWPPFHEFLRPQAVSADPDAGIVVVRLPFRPEFRRAREGSHYHGGILASLIDLTGHAAVAVRIGRMAPTIDLRIDYLSAASGVDLLATGRLLRSGRSIAQADVEVRGEDGGLVAVGRGAYSTLAPANSRGR
jgi:uncharacterized protein (TIGR00369 family)